MKYLRLLALVAAIFLLGRQVSAAEITPPFKLQWGETMTRLERLLTGAKATIVQRRKVETRDVWEVDGILPAQLQKTVFYFSQEQLVEVELQYKTTDWNEEKYNTFMNDVRRKLEAQYGAPELIARKEEPIGEIVQKVVGWKWNRNNTGIELFYFSAQNATQVFRTLSVHYKCY